MLSFLAQAQPLPAITGPGGTFDASQNATDAPGIIAELASTLLGFLTVLAGLAFILYFVLGGLSWISAGGDTAKVEAARSQMINAAIGLTVVVSSYAIIGIVGSVLGIDILDPAALLNGVAGGS